MDDINKVVELMFPPEIQNHKVGYMPPTGSESPKMYETYWREKIESFSGSLEFVDVTTKQSASLVRDLNILLLTGGNTFEFLHNLKKNGLLSEIKDRFSPDNNTDTVLAGFSAGAILQTPTIQIAGLPSLDENNVGLTDFEALNFVDFEVFPHCSEKHEKMVTDYSLKNQVSVKPISDEEYLVVDK